MTALRRSVPLVLGAALAALAIAPPPAQAASPALVTGTKVATAYPTSSALYSALEGGTTDGTYWYSAALYNRTSGSKFYTSLELLKTPLRTGAKPVRVTAYPLRDHSSSNLLGHANGMTYDSDTRQLVVAAWNNDNSRPLGGSRAAQARTIQFVSPSTLKIIRTREIGHPLTSICYDATGNRYVGRNGNSYAVYNSRFATLRTFSVPANAQVGTSQSVDCDQSYIYVIRSAQKGQKHNIVYVLNYSGKAVATYYYTTTSEGEHLTHHSGYFYAGFNIGSGQLYRLDRFQYTVSYHPGRGTGSMAPTVVLYGHATTLRRNTFTRRGYTFAGWTLQRSQDDAFLYESPTDSAKKVWRAAGTQPRGWKLSVYRNGVHVARTVTRGTLALTAVWRR